jgi:hypothetical protein
MNAVVIEHVPVCDLPSAWRDRLTKTVDTLVTVRIEEEVPVVATVNDIAADDPLFGMWRDREDMADVAGYVRSIRASRFSIEETPRKS